MPRKIILPGSTVPMTKAEAVAHVAKPEERAKMYFLDKIMNIINGTIVIKRENIDDYPQDLIISAAWRWAEKDNLGWNNSVKTEFIKLDFTDDKATKFKILLTYREYFPFENDHNMGVFIYSTKTRNTSVFETKELLSIIQTALQKSLAGEEKKTSVIESPVEVDTKTSLQQYFDRKLAEIYKGTLSAKREVGDVKYKPGLRYVSWSWNEPIQYNFTKDLRYPESKFLELNYKKRNYNIELQYAPPWKKPGDYETHVLIYSPNAPDIEKSISDTNLLSYMQRAVREMN